MWELKNETPFAVDSNFCLDDQTNELTWLVAVKATFDISSDGELSVSENQMEVFSEAQYRGEEGIGSIIYDRDFAPSKSKVDLLLNATAYAPEEKPTSDFPVRIKLGDWSKELRILGDRYWEKNFALLNTTGTSPVSQVPVTYENAYGGIDESGPDKTFQELRNPAGTGFAKNRSALIDQKLPNIEYPSFRYRKKPDKNRVAGFGAIASHWLPRLNFSGTYDEQWAKELSPSRPPDFDPRFYQSAPPDQQLSESQIHNRVELFNLTPSGILRFDLPGVKIGFETLLEDQLIPHAAKLQTLIIEPDHPRIMLVWGTCLKCQNCEDLLEFTKITYEMDLSSTP